MSNEEPTRKPLLTAKSGLHFMAGGLAGMCGAIVTAPFDVVKTRLQSDLFRNSSRQLVSTGAFGSAAVPARGLLWNFVETSYILRDIYVNESPRALFKGLVPTLAGVVPARSINFFAYGNGKEIISVHLNQAQSAAWIHLLAAANAGIITGTATNPIWVVKTRMQLDAQQTNIKQGVAAAVGRIWRESGLKGFYKGLTASYLGVTEGTIQWTLYEQLKELSRNGKAEGEGGASEWLGMLASAGASKCIASLITYPHEVIRTRLRQPLVNGEVKYSGLIQTFKVVIAEEGVRRLYGGLTAHLMRVIPNAAVMFSIYEGILRWSNR